MPDKSNTSTINAATFKNAGNTSNNRYTDRSRAKRKFSLKDPGSAITHFIGMVMAVIAAPFLIIKAANVPGNVHVISMVIFILSMICLYGASATYHSLDLTTRTNRILRKIDHMMIFVLIEIGRASCRERVLFRV